jgi:hypothetical protein
MKKEKETTTAKKRRRGKWLNKSLAVHTSGKVHVIE